LVAHVVAFLNGVEAFVLIVEALVNGVQVSFDFPQFRRKKVLQNLTQFFGDAHETDSLIQRLHLVSAGNQGP
jgi:hypothetical protein